MVELFVTNMCHANLLDFSTFWSNWEAVCFLALTTMATILGLLYMAAEIFRVPQLQAWVKFEIFQVFATAVLILLVAGLVSGMCGLKASLVTGDPALQGMDMFEGATDYLFWLRNTASQAWGKLAVINRELQRVANVTWVSRPAGFGYATSPLSGFNVYSSGASIMFSTLMLIMLTTLSQINVLQYIYIAFLTYMLPLGVLLRCLSPTRQFGGMLMGLAIGFFVLYPMMLLMNDAVVRQSASELLLQGSTLLPNIDTSDVAGDAEIMRGAQGSTKGFDLNAPPAAQPAPGGAPAPGAPPPTPAAPEPTQSEKSGTQVYNAATTIAWYLRLAFSLMVAGIVLPALNFIILITAIRELTRFLGDEIDVSSLTRMI